MRIPSLNFEELKKSKETVVEISQQGFVGNVFNSWRESLITNEQKDELLKNII